MKKNNSKKVILGAVVLLIMLISVGFAELRTTLNINGTATAKGNTWNVHFINVANKKGVTAKAEPTISGTTLTYSVDLVKPGDYYEFTVDVENTGSIAAKLSAAPTITGNSDYITHTVTYADGTAISANDELAATNGKKTVKVRVEYNSTLTQATLPTTDQATTFTVALNYVQK